MSAKAPTRAPLHRHSSTRDRHPILRMLSVFAVALAVVSVSAAGVAAYAVWDAFAGVQEAAVDLGGDVLPPTIGEIEGGVNLLLVGSDSCEGQDIALFPRCANDDAPGERNDVTMLVHISEPPRKITVVSFPRDMLVAIPACPDPTGGSFSAMSSQPLNASYGYGGLACTALTIKQLTGQDVQFAAAIRWTGVIDMSDAIGGVDVCVSGDISDPHTGLNLTAGTHTLQGVEALQFLRIRHGIGDGSDLGRISNQQQFMSSLVRKLKSDAVLANPEALFRFAATAVGLTRSDPPQLVLDSQLANPTRMVQIAMAAKDVPFDDIVFVQYPTEYTSDFINVLPLTDVADQLFAALNANKPLTLTGTASQGEGVDVTGEATEPTTAPDAGVTAAPGESTVPEERVALPAEISGTTAAQLTCTRPEE